MSAQELSSIRSSEVAMPKKHKKKYKSLKNKIKKKEQKSNFAVEDRKDQMNNSKINYYQCKFDDLKSSTHGDSHRSFQQTLPIKSAVSGFSLNKNGYRQINENRRFDKDMKKKTTYMETVKVVGLQDRSKPGIQNPFLKNTPTMSSQTVPR